MYYNEEAEAQIAAAYESVLYVSTGDNGGRK